MKDFLGIMLIVFAAMISESISKSKTDKGKETLKPKTELIQKEKKWAFTQEKKVTNLSEAYQTLLDSTQGKKEKRTD